MNPGARRTRLALLLGLLSAACGEIGPEVEIKERRTATVASHPVVPGAGARERFGPADGGASGMGSDDMAEAIDYDLPSGWKKLAATQDRLVNLQPAGDPDSSCYLSALGGNAGGLEANVNRWRAQFDAPPLSRGEILALPRHSLLGHEATLVEVSGTFKGMDEGSPRPGFRLLGLVVSEPTGSLFLKFSGPAAVVEVEREHFLSFASSLGTGSDDRAELIDYDLPSGWKKLAATRDRLVNLQPAGDPDSSCALSFLAGSAGGLESNVNRWRAQFDAPALSGAEILALPRHPLLGREATLVEVSGTFQGMGEGPPRPGYCLLGLVVSEPGGSLFLKFNGPAAVVETERERFLSLASSLRIAEGHASAGPSDTGPGASGALSWSAPSSWNKGPARAMREVTFVVGSGECYVTRLQGDAGGMLANLDRWCGQFGREALAPEALAALPRVEILGLSAPVLELTGSFQGMDGDALAGHAMLGVACCRPEESFFVKLIGPEDLVRSERANFLAFVASLKEGP